VNALVYLPNGNLASASGDKTIRIWDLDKEIPLIKTIFAHNHFVHCLVLLDDGSVASGSHDGTIKMWHFIKNSTNYTAGEFIFIKINFFKAKSN
jgi:WD40 repeat protein